MRQNTAVLGITCFIEASSVALRESERKKMGKRRSKKIGGGSKKENSGPRGGRDATFLSLNCLV